MLREAKFSVLLVGTVSTIVLFVNFGVPFSRDLVSSTLPSMWSFLRIFLVPPYLFLTVNSIIVVIWVLSEKMHHHQYSERKPQHTIDTASLKPTNTIDHHPVTVDAQLYSWTCPSETPAPTAADPDETPTTEDEAISLDATWEVIVGGGKAALKKSDTWEVPPSVGGSPHLGRRQAEMKKSETFSGQSPQRAPVLRKDVVVLGNDELNRKFEAFIKKVKDQLRLQRQESYQRYVNLIGRGTN